MMTFGKLTYLYTKDGRRNDGNEPLITGKSVNKEPRDCVEDAEKSHNDIDSEDRKIGEWGGDNQANGHQN